MFVFSGIFDYSTWLEKPPALVLFKEPYTSVTENSFESTPNTAGLLSFLGFYKGKLSHSQIVQNYHSFPKSVCKIFKLFYVLSTLLACLIKLTTILGA